MRRITRIDYMRWKEGLAGDLAEECRMRMVSEEAEIELRVEQEDERIGVKFARANGKRGICWSGGATQSASSA